MKNAIIAFMKKPTTIVGFVTALMFQLIFSVIWMTGYDGINDHVKNFKIAVVNEDHGLGQKVAENLEKNLPFHSESIDSLGAAMDLLENHDVQMVLQIPSDFSKQVMAPGQKATLFYTINESNPAMVKSVMQAVSANITAQVNRETIANGLEVALKQAKLPDPQAQGMAKGFSERVASDFKSIHPVANFSDQMIPMMLVLASYVGSMIMGLNMQQSAMALQGEVGKWKQFAARGIINVAAAVIIALVGTSLIMALGAQSEHGFFDIWMFQSLFVMTFLFVAQIFVLLFGPAGMIFNIILLSAQLVTSGAMVPRELLSDFYNSISNYLPATYAVEGNMNLLFGGPSIVTSSWSLVWIMLASIGIGTAVVAVRRDTIKQLAAEGVKIS